MTSMNHLRDLTDQLYRLKVEQVRLTSLRDAAIGRARQSGTTWAEINRACDSKNMQVTWERHQQSTTKGETE